MNATKEESNPSLETPIATRINNLIEQADILLAELEQFQTRLRSLRPVGTFAISKFREAVLTERGVLERGAANPEQEFSHNIARGSNLPFFNHVWATAKSSQDVVALPTRWMRKSTGIDLVNRVQRLNRDEKPHDSSSDKVLIDVICDGGTTWNKVSLITNKRLLFDLAKQGWESDGSEAESDPEAQDVPLLKTAKELIAAAKHTRVLTKHPKVHLILPRLERGQIVAVDKVLDAISDCGAVVFCKDECPPAPQIEDALPVMVRDPQLRVSETLNLDCTILLALVSDLSHTKVCPRAWFHDHLRRQIEREIDDRLLPSTLYPILGDRKLVCTKEAAHRMQEIVDTIGTPSEKVRTAILLGYDPCATREHLVEEMQRFSTYNVCSDLQLPITVVDRDHYGYRSLLPSECSNIGDKLSPINKAVFMYGWMSGLTTITSNRSAIKKIEQELERLENLNQDQFPSIWVCPVARSLVGKEKHVQLSNENHEIASELGDGLSPEALK